MKAHYLNAMGLNFHFQDDMLTTQLTFLLVAIGTIVEADLSRLPTNYTKMESPEKPTMVEIDIKIRQVKNVNDLEQFWAIDISFWIHWTDHRLINQLGHAKHLDIEALNEIWRPDPFIYNARDSSIVQIYDRAETLNIDTSKGELRWWFLMSVQGDCPMDFTRFPLDSHTCPFIMGSSIADSSEQVYFTDTDNLLRFNTMVGGTKILQYNIKIVPLDGDQRSVHAKLTNRTFSVTGFQMKLTRRVLPYMVSWYLPTGTLVVISWISFFVPPAQVPGRMALLVTIFLMLVNISNVSQQTNPKSKGFTALDLWIGMCMVSVAMALFEYAELLRIRFNKTRSKIREIGAMDDDAHKTDTLCRTVDNISALTFVTTFFFFNIAYWSYLLLSKPSDNV